MKPKPNKPKLDLKPTIEILENAAFRAAKTNAYAFAEAIRNEIERLKEVGK